MTLCLFCLLIGVGVVQAQESEHQSFKKNSIELFLGGTYADSETDPSIGLAYERRLNEKLGLGGIVEYTRSDEWVLAVPLYFHAAEPWKFFVVPGVEIEDEGESFLIRVGAAYEFEFQGWSLAPELSMDYVDDDVKVVFGLNFGVSF
ncbi:hypothetical protein ACFL17_02740 [Pseudomonadota bacterium]